MTTLQLGKNIELLRKKFNFTQEELAHKLGVSNQAVSKWETGQCYPDILLLPKLAAVFATGIDELFGGEKSYDVDGCCLPLCDDDIFRVFVIRGNRIVSVTDAEKLSSSKPIEIRFLDNNTKKDCCYKVEVFGNVSCNYDINGDVICHGNIECNCINGNIQECRESVSCQGDIRGGVSASQNLTCGGSINGAVFCGHSLTCEGSINGGVTCEHTVACDNIFGEVKCDGHIHCSGIQKDMTSAENIVP